LFFVRDSPRVSLLRLSHSHSEELTGAMRKVYF
jgi:hypothetical protein